MVDCKSPSSTSPKGSAAYSKASLPTEPPGSALKGLLPLSPPRRPPRSPARHSMCWSRSHCSRDCCWSWSACSFFAPRTSVPSWGLSSWSSPAGRGPCPRKPATAPSLMPWPRVSRSPVPLRPPLLSSSSFSSSFSGSLPPLAPSVPGVGLDVMGTHGPSRPSRAGAPAPASSTSRARPRPPWQGAPGWWPSLPLLLPCGACLSAHGLESRHSPGGRTVGGKCAPGRPDPSSHCVLAGPLRGRSRWDALEDNWSPSPLPASGLFRLSSPGPQSSRPP